MTDEHETSAVKRLGEALVEIEGTSPQATEGKWLERLTADCAPLIAEWDVRSAWTWDEWPGNDHPESGIDVIAERTDGQFIAIQCKSRQLDDRQQFSFCRIGAVGRRIGGFEGGLTT